MLLIVVVAVILLLTVVPVMIAARIVGARRTGFGSSLLALIVSSLIVGIAVRLFHGGGLLSIFAAALGFMLILDTTYLRALGVVVLQYLFIGLIAVVLMFTAIGSMVHVKDLMQQIPAESPRSESV
jgi:hypothetical protein